MPNTKKTVSISVAGAMGRMGQAILNLALKSDTFSVSGAVEASHHPQLREDVGRLLKRENLGVYLTDELGDALKNADALITFTTPDATMEHLAACLGKRKGLVIGTTGLMPKHMKDIQNGARKIPIVQAPNMSIGVNLLLTLTKIAAAKLGPDYDIEIVEAHHRLKKDAPSGTALKLAEVAAESRRIDLTKMGEYGRRGMTGERKKGTIGIHAVRGGDVVGEHTVEFMAAGERLGLFHKASSRDAFASGALLAAQFVVGKKNGLWTMQDVLGL